MIAKVTTLNKEVVFKYITNNQNQKNVIVVRKFRLLICIALQI